MASANVDIKKLRAFYLVAKHGTLQGAATRLLLSTSAISIQVSQLEKELGTKLFRRDGRKLALEPSAKVFLDHVETVLKALDEAVASVSNVKAPKQRISIAVGPDLTRIFSSAIGKFMKHHPDVEIALQLKNSQESLARVLDGDIDMVVGYFGKVPNELVKQTLMKSGFSMSYAAFHPLAAMKSPTLRDVARYPIIALRQQTNMGQRILRAFDDAGTRPVNFLEVGNCQSSQELAAQGIGVAIAHTTCLDGYKASEMCSMDASQFFGRVDVAVAHRKSSSFSALHQELVDDMASLAEDQRQGRRAYATA